MLSETRRATSLLRPYELFELCSLVLREQAEPVPEAVARFASGVDEEFGEISLCLIVSRPHVAVLGQPHQLGLVEGRLRSRVSLGSSSQPPSPSSESASSKSAAAAAAILLASRVPEAERSSSTSTLRILSVAGIDVYWSGFCLALDLVMIRPLLLLSMMRSPLTIVSARRGSFKPNSLERAITFCRISS